MTEAEPHGAVEVEGDAPVEATQGLRADYYRAAVDHAAQRVDPAIDFAWTAPPAPGVGGGAFAVRWTGTLVPPAPGTYKLALHAEDGARLWIGGALAIDAWSDGAHDPAPHAVELTGPTPLMLTLYARTSTAHVQLRWQRPDGGEEIVPTAALVPAPTVDPPLASPPPPYTNSVDDSGCADPGAIAVDGTYYLACTGGRFRIRTSRDLVTWTTTSHDILPPAGAPWAGTTGFRWAPEIHAVGARFVAYFVSADAAGERAIGAAVADAPLGPWTVQPAPLLTDDPVGVIDPSYFHDDDGRSYLLYKRAGNSVGKPTPILLRELRADGLAFAPGSAPVQLITNDPTTWEGPLVEAPWLLKRAGSYYLFYSGNIYDERYRVGVARAASVRGPYTKHGAPILGNNARWLGPGHNSSVQVDGSDYLVYHAWRAGTDGKPDTAMGRVLMVDRVTWTGGWPRIDTAGTPSVTPRPRPGVDPDLH